MIGTVGSRYSRARKKEGGFRVQKVSVPVNITSFRSSPMPSSVPHIVPARGEAREPIQCNQRFCDDVIRVFHEDDDRTASS